MTSDCFPTRRQVDEALVVWQPVAFLCSGCMQVGAGGLACPRRRTGGPCAMLVHHEGWAGPLSPRGHNIWRIRAHRAEPHWGLYLTPFAKSSALCTQPCAF